MDCPKKKKTAEESVEAEIVIRNDVKYVVLQQPTSISLLNKPASENKSVIINVVSVYKMKKLEVMIRKWENKTKKLFIKTDRCYMGFRIYIL